MLKSKKFWMEAAKYASGVVVGVVGKLSWDKVRNRKKKTTKAGGKKRKRKKTKTASRRAA